MNTAFGTSDNVSSMFSLFRFSLGSAWDISDRLRAGIAFASTYASVEQELFYDTSIAEGDSVFFGVKVRELSGWGVDAKVGLQYDLTKNITAGINYTSASKIDLDDGRMSVNYSALGLGRVRYNNVNMKGLELPQEFGLGLAWRIDDHWKVFTEANWFDWENSTGALTITARDPNSETPPEAKKLRQRSTVKMNSEIVYSFGIEKTLGTQRSIMAGYSYHDLVINRQSLSPTFALIPQHDFSVGYKTPLSSNWLINLALAYQPRLEESYNNPELPFGKSTEINQSIAIHATITSVK